MTHPKDKTTAASLASSTLTKRLRAAEQAGESRAEVKNPNAWLKAAFERNGGPLITERDIEARLTRGEAQKEAKVAPRTAEHPKDEDPDVDVMRRYMAAPAVEKDEIDRRAEEKAAPMLKRVGADKHAGILEQARIEVAREVLGDKG